MIVCRCAIAAPEDDLIFAASQRNLAAETEWLRLLHLNSQEQSDQVVSEKFYLAPDGRRDPKAELEATIRAYFAPWEKDGNRHPRCRFPARYLWLSQRLSIPSFDPHEPRCVLLNKWANLEEVHSVSLYLIGGYFGNPASTFGHAVLKLNTGQDNSVSPLFDMTIGFGATVPEKEWIMRYIVKGIFGQYNARFLDRYYYAQDLVYSRSEFRDIWDFTLNLTKEQQMFLAFHLWELLGNDFTYYFFDKNCAYKLGELMEFFVREPIADAGFGWYPPVELFNRLRDSDAQRIERGEPPIVQSVTFIPSTQRVLLRQLRRLSPAQRSVFDTIVAAGSDAAETELQALPVSDRFAVLDALLAYGDYRITAAGKDATLEQKRFRDGILLARLRLPSSTARLEPVPELPSPAHGSRPAQFGVAAAWDRQSAFTRVSWSPFSWETVGQNSLEGGELVVSELTLGVFEKDESFFVDRYDLIRVINFDTSSDAIADSSGISWQVRVGSERARHDGEEKYDAIASFGGGKAWRMSESLLGYGMMDVAAHSVEEFARLRPHVGIRLDGGAAKAWIYGGVESEHYGTRVRDIWGGKAQWQLTEGSALQAEVSNERATRYSIGMAWYF